MDFSRQHMRREKAPWYSEGVPFTCVPDCGKCCDQPGGVVFLARHDAEKIAAHKGMDVQSWLDLDCRRSADGRWVIQSNSQDGSCIYLEDDKRCAIYEAKPDQCSAFPWWNENMRSSRAWRKTVQLCPGLRQSDAEIITLPVIESHLKADAVAEKGFRVWNRDV
jgi:Fe-S-cluster containining protein